MKPQQSITAITASISALPGYTLQNAPPFGTRTAERFGLFLFCCDVDLILMSFLHDFV